MSTKVTSLIEGILFNFIKKLTKKLFSAFKMKAICKEMHLSVDTATEKQQFTYEILLLSVIHLSIYFCY